MTEHDFSIEEVELFLDTVRNHLQTAQKELDSIPRNLPIKDYPQYAEIESCVKSLILTLEVRQAMTPAELETVAVMWINTGREMHAQIYNRWTDEHGTEHALSKVGRAVKELYYSKLMNRWVITD